MVEEQALELQCQYWEEESRPCDRLLGKPQAQCFVQMFKLASERKEKDLSMVLPTCDSSLEAVLQILASLGRV